MKIRNLAAAVARENEKTRREIENDDWDGLIDPEEAIVPTDDKKAYVTREELYELFDSTDGDEGLSSW